MTLIESIKRTGERLTGWARPARRDLAELCRARKPVAFRFRDDGLIPNHPDWPLVLYRGAVRFPNAFDPAAVLEDLFEAHGWGDSWRDGIYNYVHYHSRIHEVLGVARGSGRVRFGGRRGRTLRLKAGDVVILPAGTGHQRISASKQLLVVGAYPPSGSYDECMPLPEHHARALKSIPKVPAPAKDPVYGRSGPLQELWRRS
jgi:uncharacterized protein YjlB